jgi:hypothetical protein
MSAGLPGLGLGGLFFILSALAAPVREVVRTLRGQSDAASWLRVGRNFALALAMIAALEGMLRLAYLGIDLTDLGESPSASAPTVLPLVPIAITAGLLATVLGCAKSMQLVALARSQRTPLPVLAPSPRRVRALAGGFAVTACWFALLMFGASELSPVSEAGSGPAVAAGPDRDVAEAEPAPLPDGPSIAAREAIAPDGTSRSAPAAESKAAPAPGLDTAPGSSSATNSPVPATAATPDEPQSTFAAAQPAPQPEPPAATSSPSPAGADQASGPPAHAAAAANPSPPDHAGRPEHAGPPEHAGRPEHADSSAYADPTTQ